MCLFLSCDSINSALHTEAGFGGWVAEEGEHICGLLKVSI